MDNLKLFAVPVLFLIISAFSIESRTIFDTPDDKPGFIRLGSPADHHRSKRSYNDDRGAQNVYYISRTPADWGTAWLTCRQAMNGQLLTIETKAEDLFIRDLLMQNQISPVWTSGAYDPDRRIWRWVSTGGAVTYTNWLAGQPNPIYYSRIVVQNSLFSSGWDTMSEYHSYYYICEVRSSTVALPSTTQTPGWTHTTTWGPTHTPTPTVRK